MKALKIVGYVLVSIIAILFVVVLMLMQPSHGHVEKSVVINAPASAIFPYLNDFKKRNEWSSRLKMDPDSKQTFEGTESSVNAKMSWEGPQTGKGSQVITESIENEKVKVALIFKVKKERLGSILF